MTFTVKITGQFNGVKENKVYNNIIAPDEGRAHTWAEIQGKKLGFTKLQCLVEATVIPPKSTVKVDKKPVPDKGVRKHVK